MCTRAAGQQRVMLLWKGKKWNLHAHPLATSGVIPTFLVWTVTVDIVTVAASSQWCEHCRTRHHTASATSYLTAGRIPTAGEASNGAKYCWQWVKVTDGSHFTSAAIPNHRAPVLWSDTFSFTPVSSPRFPLLTSPKLTLHPLWLLPTPPPPQPEL